MSGKEAPVGKWTDSLTIEMLPEQYQPLLLCEQVAKIFQTICKKEMALKRVLRDPLSAISFAQI